MEFQIQFAFDLTLVLVSLWCVLQCSERSIFNPSLWWIGLHFFAFTFRLYQLCGGAHPIYLLGIKSNTELIRAALASEISLVFVVAATVLVTYFSTPGPSPAEKPPVPLNLSLGWLLAIIYIPLGIFMMTQVGGLSAALIASGTDISSVDLGELGLATYPLIMANYALEGSLLLVAMRGFTWWSTPLFFLCLAANSITATRTFLVLPLILVFLIYQTRHRKKSISLRWAVFFGLLGMLWFVYKPIQAAIIAGDPSLAVKSVQGYIQTNVSDDTTMDTAFLDMQATYMASSDEHHLRFYGASVLPLLALPVPRFLWPGKPSVNILSAPLTTGERQIALVGMTPNLTGAAYLDFGWLGCAFVPFLYMFAMQWAFRRVSNDGIDSARRWLYLIFLVSLIQVFRDGLISVVIFPFIQFSALTSWWFFSTLYYRFYSRQRSLEPAVVLHPTQ